MARRSLRRAVMSSSALANQIVQLSTDAKTRPSMTALTTMSAATNMPQGDRSRGSVSATAGAAAGAATAGAAGTGVTDAGADAAGAGVGAAGGVVCA